MSMTSKNTVIEMWICQTTAHFSILHLSISDELRPREARFWVLLIFGFCYARQSFNLPLEI